MTHFLLQDPFSSFLVVVTDNKSRLSVSVSVFCLISRQGNGINGTEEKTGAASVRLLFFLSLTERNGRGEKGQGQRGFLSVRLRLSPSSPYFNKWAKERRKDGKGDKLQSFTLSLKSASISPIITYTIEREIKVGTSPPPPPFFFIYHRYFSFCFPLNSFF